MLEVTITFKQSTTGKTSTIGRAEIVNDGTGDKSLGNYRFRLSTVKGVKEIVREGRVKDFPRLKLSAWNLLYRVLQAAVEEGA